MSDLFAGIDSGSWNTKVAVVEASNSQVIGTAVVRSAADLRGAAASALDRALATAGKARSDLTSIWSTGFGRRSLDLASGSRTELDCHARGVCRFVEGPLTIVDIGGQDAKVIRLDANQHRVSHKLNRKCAAGTGSFLEEIALRLGVGIGGLHDLAAGYGEELQLGSFCTVFTGTELLGLIRAGKRPADLARAAYRSLVKRVLEMDVLEGRVVATGGVVAHHPMVVELLERALGVPVTVPPHAHEIGAVGAALAAMEMG